MDVIKCRSTKTMHLFPNPKAHDARPGCPKHRVRDAWAMENGANYEVLAAPANPSSENAMPELAPKSWMSLDKATKPLPSSEKAIGKKRLLSFDIIAILPLCALSHSRLQFPSCNPQPDRLFGVPGLCEFQASPAPPAETGSRPLADEGTPRCRDDRRSRGVTRSKSGELGHGIAQHGFLLMRAASAGSGM